MFKKKAIFSLMIIVSMAFVNLPYVSVLAENPITVVYEGDDYELFYQDMKISDGQGEVTNLRYDLTATELYLLYDVQDTTRFAFSNDIGHSYSNSFVDIDIGVMGIDDNGSPSEIYQELIYNYPEFVMQPLSESGTNYCGGTTEGLTLCWSGYKDFDLISFKGSVWYLDGIEYNGWWIATMQVDDHDLFGEGKEFQTVYRWIGPDIKLPPPDRRQVLIDDELEYIYPYLWWWHNHYGWFNDGYVGAAEVEWQEYETWGWYYEEDRNTKGDRYAWPTWEGEEYLSYDFIAKEIGSKFSNTQSVSFIQIGHPDAKLKMVWWLEKTGFFGEEQHFDWFISLDLDELLE